MIEQLPVLQILVPMLTAPLCVLSRRPIASWVLALAATWFALATSIQLLLRVLAEGTISYELGGWPPPWGIELRIDLVNVFVLLIVTAICSVVLTAAPRSLAAEISRERHYLFYAAYLLCMTGLLGMAATGDAFNVFVFLEISSLSSYILISLGPTRRALHSAFQYLVMGTLGGTFVLLGVGMLYMVTGTLNIVDMGERLAELGPNRTVLVALAVIVVGTSIKLALFPLHAWLPNAYTFAPALVTAFLAATATKVAYYVLVRFVFRVFGVDLAFGALRLDTMLMPVAILAMFIASTVAIYQRDVKRLLAYSSLAQIGYMVLGLSLASVTGLTGGIVHLFNHAIMKSALFMALACVMLRIGSTRLDDLSGLGKRMPLTAAAFVGGGLGLIGVPLTAGFVSKWYLVLAALEGGYWPVAVLILLSSLLAVIYVWRVVEVAYFRPPPEDAAPVEEAPWSLLIPTWVLVGATFYFGISTSVTVDVAAKAAQMLVNGGGP
ncbi:MAG: monovalent cation/H+ antiporter subunit D family protein [Acidobacteriota bacterium]